MTKTKTRSVKRILALAITVITIVASGDPSHAVFATEQSPGTPTPVAGVERVLPAAQDTLLFLPLALRALVPAEIRMTAVSATLDAVIGAKTIVTVELQREDSTPLAQYPVSLTTTTGTIVSFQGNTDDQGKFTATLTVTEAQTGTARITASAGDKTQTLEIAITPPGCNDIEDANDSTLDAAPPELTTPNGVCRGSLQDDPVGEDDYYQLLLQSGQTVTLQLGGIPAGGDYSLLFYNISASSNPLASSKLPGNNDEQIVYQVNATAAYQIRIRQDIQSASATNSYLLRVVVQ